MRRTPGSRDVATLGRYDLVTLFALLFIVLPGTAFGQQQFLFHASADFTFAVDDNPQLGDTGGGQNLAVGWTNSISIYPTIRVETRGPRFNGEFFYTFGQNWFESRDEDEGLNYQTHIFGGRGDFRLNEKWSLAFSDSYIRSPDFASGTILEGIRVTPEGLFFDFDNVLLRRKSWANRGNVDLTYRFAPRSDLTFGVSHQMRRYSEDEDFPEVSDQDTLQGNVGYRRHQSDRTSWDITYRFRELNFQEFENARTHEGTLGFSHQISPRTTLTLGAGPSYVEPTDRAAGQGYWGYNARFNVSRLINDEQNFSFFYNRDSGTSSGVGSVSDTDRIGLNYGHLLRRNVTLDFGVSLYKTRQRFDNPVYTEGLQSRLSIGYQFNRNLSLSVGAQYLTQDGTSTFNLDRKRVFTTLRIDFPSFARF